MNEQEQLSKILNNNKGDKNFIRMLCQVMEKVGGYDVLFGYTEEVEYSFWKFKIKRKLDKPGMPVAAVFEVMKYLEWMNEEQQKVANKKLNKHGSK